MGHVDTCLRRKPLSKMEFHSWRIPANVQLSGSQTQRGVVHYGLSANAQRPLAGAGHAAIFNVWRRFSHQVLYFAPPLIIAYVTMEWAIERFVYTLLARMHRLTGRLETSI